jgi:hypothetical protein
MLHNRFIQQNQISIQKVIAFTLTSMTVSGNLQQPDFNLRSKSKKTKIFSASVVATKIKISHFLIFRRCFHKANRCRKLDKKI